jgi:topoisomerase-4 subunit A
MAIKKTPGKNPATEQADLFSNSLEMDIVEVEEAPKAAGPSSPKGPNDPHDPKTVDLNEDNKIV